MNKKSNFNKFMVLFENDFYRSLKFMIPVMIIFVITHLTSTIISISSYNKTINHSLKTNGQLSEYDKYFSMNKLIAQNTIMQIMIISMVGVVLYTIVLWAREWSGAAKSSYTLLTLPVKRKYILTAKICTMIVYLSMNFILQLITLFIDNGLLKAMINKDNFINYDVLSCIMGIYKIRSKAEGDYMSLLSLDPVSLCVNFLLALSFIILLGLLVLLYRSFKFKGAFLGLAILVLYTIGYIFIPRLLKFYYFEILYFRGYYPILLIILGFMWSVTLLNKKVSI